MGRDYSRNKYLQYRKAAESFILGNHRGKKQNKKNVAGEDENNVRLEDPQPLAQVLEGFIQNRQWVEPLSEGNFLAHWSEVVGDEIAAHATPLTLDEGVLTIQATSTAWATQLNLIAVDLLAKIQNSADGVLVERIVVLPPKPPSWKKGVRSIKGARGPRDTYS
jgi:predicted nucleic acid-binding Zn ribbon protein